MTDRFSEDNQDEVDAEGGHLVETPETLRDDDQETSDRGSGAADRPFGAEKFGTTHAEAEDGESLDQKLAEERPEVGAHDPVEDIVADDPSTFGGGEETDEEVLGESYGDPDNADTETDAGDLAAVDRDEANLPAEEAALHVEED
jgi:hypothetical protein